ncbi:SagB/ThcOx family dehydrogenase [Streptacidiphilus sp. PAMC 29251]
MSVDPGTTSSALDFHRTAYADAAMLSTWVMLPVDKWPEEWFTYNSKSFPRLEGVELPDPGEPPSGSGAEWLAARSSHRSALEQVTVAELSKLLWYTTHSESPEQYAPGHWHRPYPSAGGRLGCEFYLLAHNVTGLPSGVYSYGVAHHRLARLRSGMTGELLRFLFGDGWVTRTCAVLMLTASLDRLEMKYGSRGYRYALMEAGAAAQTTCLVAGAMSVGTCVLGGFADAPMAQLLLCTPDSEVPVTAIAFSGIEEGR